MIVEEFIDGGKFVKHYSDKGMLISKVGTEELYDVAIDIVPCKFEYAETSIPIEPEEE